MGRIGSREGGEAVVRMNCMSEKNNKIGIKVAEKWKVSIKLSQNTIYTYMRLLVDPCFMLNTGA